MTVVENGLGYTVKLLSSRSGETLTLGVLRFGWVIVATQEQVALFLSLEINVYVPALRFSNKPLDWNVIPSLLYSYGIAPPVAMTVTLPLLPPNVVTLLFTTVEQVNDVTGGFVGVVEPHLYTIRSHGVDPLLLYVSKIHARTKALA